MDTPFSAQISKGMCLFKMSFTVSCISHFYHTLVPPLEDDPPLSAPMKEQYFLHPGVQKNVLKS